MSRNLHLTHTSSLSFVMSSCQRTEEACALTVTQLLLRSFPVAPSHPSSKTVLDCLCFEPSAARINIFPQNATEKWKNCVPPDLDVLLHVFLADKCISWSPVLYSYKTQHLFKLQITYKGQSYFNCE